MRNDVRVRFVEKLYAVFGTKLTPNTIFFIEKHRDDLKNTEMFFVYDYTIATDSALNNPTFEYFFNMDMYFPENMIEQMPEMLQRLRQLSPDYIVEEISTADKLEDYYVRNVRFRITI